MGQGVSHLSAFLKSSISQALIMKCDLIPKEYIFYEIS
jgi:hypothetical protein